MGKDGVSAKQIRDRVAMFGGRCWVCFKPYEQIDHVKPLARGGRHIAANLRPICKACNIKKKAKWPFRREMVA